MLEFSLANGHFIGEFDVEGMASVQTVLDRLDTLPYTFSPV